MASSYVEVENLHDFKKLLATGQDLNNVVIQSIDLRDHAGELAQAKLHGAIFLGCTFHASSIEIIQARGGLIFPQLPHLPLLNPYRAVLYSANELYNAERYADSTDSAIYAWSRTHSDLATTLAQCLHDHAMSDALSDLLSDHCQQPIVGIMGGHVLSRDSEGYRQSAKLGLKLAQQGFMVASGGGPGAMEAANLGALLKNEPEILPSALDQLAAVPSFKPNIDAWSHIALTIRGSCARPNINLGIPTWFYGHEPPNVFATHIAKYFSNDIREGALLSCCRGGLVYLPGAAGTVQELFQAVTANYYATEPSLIAPLVLVGIQQWRDSYPAWSLLEALARGRTMHDRIRLVDTVSEAFEWLIQFSNSSVAAS